MCKNVDYEGLWVFAWDIRKIVGVSVEKGHSLVFAAGFLSYDP